jgi:hypothetical protein
MRINLVGNFRKNTGLMQDGSIIRGLLTAVFGDDVNIFRVPHHFPQCQEAEVNIFIEVLNPSLLAYAGRNIWIPNLEWTYRAWEPYVTMFDEIWVKTEEASHKFKMLCEGTQTKVYNIGWTSIDKIVAEKKNYSKAIVLVGKNIFRNPKQLFRAYDEIRKVEPNLYTKLPHLYVPYNPDYVTLFCPEELSSKVTMMNKELAEQEYDDLLNECGLAICLSAAEGFGHAVNEAMSSGCNLILSPIGPFRQLTNGMSDAVLYSEASHILDQPDCMGILVDSGVPSIVQALKTYVSRDFKTRKAVSDLSRFAYEKRHASFVDSMKLFLTSLSMSPTYELKNLFPKEEELPDVSIVTLTKDRRIFMPLAKYSYMIQSYPEDKLEWVIVDDGEDSIEDTLIGVPNVKYVRSDPGMTIGEKRNVGVQNAMYDTIVMMDDDDVYPNNSVLHRVAMMMKSPQKECVFSTTIPCYDIKKYSSFMNVPPLTLRMSERVSEATLAFTKKFWEQNKFDNIHIAEGNAFIHGRESMCREVSPQEVIVSLCHPKNTSSRKIPDFKEANGCHYGFNEKLFALVSEIGEKI